MSDIVETASQAGSFKTLIDAVEAAGLGEVLKAPGPITLLAPTDDAFAKLSETTRNELMQNIPKLKRILMYHVLPGDVRAEDLAEIDEAPTAEGSIVAVENSDNIRVNDAQVTQTDILADNGVIHVIDTVLIPALVAAE